MTRNRIEALQEEINKTVFPALLKFLRPDVIDKFDSTGKNTALAYYLSS
jgi:hypothetical protein